MANPDNTEKFEDGHEQSNIEAVPQSELDRWMDDGGHCPDQVEAPVSHEK